MKIAVITLPLHTNYGGVLQAYALKKVLEGLGHEVDVIDREAKFVMPPAWKMPFVHCKRMFLNLISFGKGPEVYRERRIMAELPVVGKDVMEFTRRHVAPRIVRDYRDLRMGEYDAFVVGSDQVWRPDYFGRIEDAFLQFTSSWNVKRISYAASFGTDLLEYTYQQLDACSRLLKRFDAVSVREDSGVAVCDEWLDVENVKHVLDPVMLMSREAYSALASGASSRPAADKLMLYILDKNPRKQAVVNRVSLWFEDNVHDASVAPLDPAVPLESRTVPSMEQWLSCFEDASFIVTDSFHATVLAIIFHKPFIVLGNQKRGLTRITSLLEQFGLESRLVDAMDPDDESEYYLSGIDWEDVDSRLEALTGKSMDFLANALK